MASTPVDAPEVGTRPAPKHNKNSPQKEHIYSFLMNLELLDNWSPVSEKNMFTGSKHRV